MDFFSNISLHPPTAHLVAKGELDAFSGVRLRGRISDAIDRGCVSFTLDFSGVTFADASGLGTLVQMSMAATAVGGSVSFVAASPKFLWVSEVAGLGERFAVSAA
ncbi:STAS domain-containing protein [Nocardioides sp. CN2-186]|uniref:STAS domain-containing protein n=1 Tax=Nocardioides tweenelious TaxID=3156607 RepID=UPI0032B3BAC1